jgi:hypothetical protein
MRAVSQSGSEVTVAFTPLSMLLDHNRDNDCTATSILTADH